ncbi:hypothetical protein J4421_05890 [Candidatus Woesearchaeota archaeon]|nr:hypothetical protein [Candidatus Woesearchaeota archaeon]
MDWKAGVKTRTAKEAKQDLNLIQSTKEIADIKITSANFLPKELFIGKITLLYDALREYLESIALTHGYKIYNHECYTPFLKEVLHLPREADLFDKLRKVRNAINYYGRKVSKEEAENILKDLVYLIGIFKKKLKK